MIDLSPTIGPYADPVCTPSGSASTYMPVIRRLSSNTRTPWIEGRRERSASKTSPDSGREATLRGVSSVDKPMNAC
jgi:hypothetical protein